MPKITINGVETEVKEGTTIIEAMKGLGQEIAHYCWHPGLSIAGVCRLCMVEIEGNPRLQIACNTPVRDGMVVSNQSEKVKETVKWGLDFHLINHPLDCPICDQAGECGLQDQYMQFGKYDPEMAERKVKKRKVVDLGKRVVLDSERCILCSRCVRFTDEVSKTHELGIFNRGDRSEIGTFEDKPLDNNYSLNTVDICPVGALTSKDFRFRQRVWYLKDGPSVCPSCSTGCNVQVYYNEEGLFRIKPRHNPDVNGYWMCDKGRDAYKFVNKKVRLSMARLGTGDQWQDLEVQTAVTQVADLLKSSGEKIGLVLTGQYTSEEYDSIIGHFKNDLNSTNIYHWINNPDQMEDFDGLLLRGDRNPNTKGLLQALDKLGVGDTWSQLENKLAGGEIETLVVAGPEIQSVFPDIESKMDLFSKAKNLVWLTPGPIASLNNPLSKTYLIPTKTFVEKSGTFVNFQGREQRIEPVTLVQPKSLDLNQFALGLKGEAIDFVHPALARQRKKNHFVNIRGDL